MKSGVTESRVEPLSSRHLIFIVPLLLLHLGCLLVFWVGVSPVAVVTFVVLSFVRCFGITAGYHRLLSHQSYRTSRMMRFMISLMGVLAGQNGPIWWVAHHRIHHRFSDTDKDVHSPAHGFFWSHMGWLLSSQNTSVLTRLVPDLIRQPEIVFLQRYYYLFHGLLIAGLFILGEALQQSIPEWKTSGLQLVVWGGIFSMVFVFHCVWSANSVCHKYGTRRFQTRDNSRNNFFVALFTLGDGWHNNHHKFPSSARHGMVWWELDVNYWILRLLQLFGVIWDLKVPSRQRVLENSMHEV